MSAPSPIVNATRFRLVHESSWGRLEEMVTRLERRSARALSADELLEFPSLYRSTVSALSTARNVSLDRALIHYLEQLSARAYLQIYGVKTPPGRQVADFFARGLPTAMRSMWRETVFCVVLMAAAAVLAFLLVRHDPSWFYSIIPDGLGQGRDPSADARFLRESLYDSQNRSWLGVFATFLFTHNAQMAIFAFALGFAFGMPTILLILYNGLSLGAMIAVFSEKQLGGNFAAWLTIHGTTELLAICIAGGAGLRIGTAIAFPGRWSRMDNIVNAGRTAATGMIGVVIMLAIAGLLEGIGRQLVQSDVLRVTIGAGALIIWVFYFYAWVRPKVDDG